MIKVVMGTIMIIVAVSRALAVPEYLEQLGFISMSKSTIHILDLASFLIMCLALAVGAVIILGAMWKGRRAAEPHAAPIVTESYEHV